MQNLNWYKVNTKLEINISYWTWEWVTSKKCCWDYLARYKTPFPKHNVQLWELIVINKMNNEQREFSLIKYSNLVRKYFLTRPSSWKADEQLTYTSSHFLRCHDVGRDDVTVKYRELTVRSGELRDGVLDDIGEIDGKLSSLTMITE